MVQKPSINRVKQAFGNMTLLSHSLAASDVAQKCICPELLLVKC